MGRNGYTTDELADAEAELDAALKKDKADPPRRGAPSKPVPRAADDADARRIAQLKKLLDT